MGLASWFSFGIGAGNSGTTELPEIFPMPIDKDQFVKIDIFFIYTKILTDVIERTQGLTDEEQALLWDNCLASESAEGLVTMLAKAMEEKADLFIVYDKATKVIRRAKPDEQTQIKADYEARAESTVGTYVSFKNYRRTDMVRVYSSLEFLTVAALNKMMNLAKAIQLKIAGMRGAVAAVDAADVQKQGVELAGSMKQGRDVMIDKDDSVENAKPDLTATNTAFDRLNQKRSFYLGFPASYITGELNSGLGDSGNADARAIERGLKLYFVSIVKPVGDAVFKKKLTFKSEDQAQLSTSLEALKTFEITSDEHLSAENKTKIVNKLFGLDEDEKGDPPKKVEAPPTGDPAAGARDVTPPAKPPGR